MLHFVTIRALKKRNFTDENLSFILGVTPQAAHDIISGEQVPTSQQLAILKLLACIDRRDIARVMEEKGETYEWVPIEGFERYEVSKFAQIRRSAAGKGSMPGVVLKQSYAPDGRLKVTLYDNAGNMRTRPVHRIVCRAFHGPKPSPDHMVCHRNDDVSNNTADNLYWGTAKDNARDRIANSPRKMVESGYEITKIGTDLTQKVKTALSEGKISKAKARKIIKQSMDYNIRRSSE